MSSTATIQGGYTFVRADTLGSLLSALRSGTLCYRAARTFFSCLSMAAIRYAAHCAKEEKKEFLSLYSLSEIHERVGGVGGQYLKEDLASLEAHSLLQFSEKDISIPHHDTRKNEVLEDLCPSRSSKRLIPVPRRVLEYLCSCSRPSITKTILALLLRALSLTREGIIKTTGSIKASLIASATGISLRAAKAARQALVRVGFLIPDTGSNQHKLNKTGAYFSINTEWNPLENQDELASQEEEEVASEEVELISKSEFAPPLELPTGESAPPYKDLIPSKEVFKYQNLKRAGSGVLTNKKKFEKRGILSSPSINNIHQEELFHFPRLETLYRQAVEARWFPHSESMALNWLSAAVRARRTTTGNPVRIFVGIVKKKLWKNITNKEEDIAREALQKFRNRDESFYRLG
jgi:hypothetical protein